MIEVTQPAAKAVKRFIRGSGQPNAGLRLRVSGGGCSGLQYEMDLEERAAADDLVIDAGGFSLFVDSESAKLLEGMTIDFVDTLAESGFVFRNPNAQSTCGCGKSFSA